MLSGSAAETKVELRGEFLLVQFLTHSTRKCRQWLKKGSQCHDLSIGHLQGANTLLVTFWSYQSGEQGEQTERVRSTTSRGHSSQNLQLTDRPTDKWRSPLAWLVLGISLLPVRSWPRSTALLRCIVIWMPVHTTFPRLERCCPAISQRALAGTFRIGVGPQ